MMKDIIADSSNYVFTRLAPSPRLHTSDPNCLDYCLLTYFCASVGPNCIFLTQQLQGDKSFDNLPIQLAWGRICQKIMNQYA
jgi:hypothetical protein